MIDRNHIAWAAGFFDGEGSISAVRDNRRGETYSVTMTVVQVGSETSPPDTLIRFAEIAGVGRITRRSSIGRLGKQPQWVWRLHNIENVKSFSKRLFPYLGTAKTNQIALALALRAESEGLTADRRLFCKKGHRREFRGDSGKPFRCWECHEVSWRASRLRRRLAVVAASGKEV